MDLDVIKTAKLLVALENGEQHVLTIMPHKQNCTLGELLERIDVPVEHDLNVPIKVEPLPFQIKVEPDENSMAVEQEQQLHQPNIASTSQAQTMQLQNLQIQLPVSHCNM